MAQSVLTESFSSEMLPSGKAIKVVSDDATVEIYMDLKRLAQRLLNDRQVDAMDKAVAGAAILHLMALVKAG